MEIQAEISYQTNKKYMNQKIETLIEGTLREDPNQLIGRARFQAPEVDGVIFLNSPHSLARVVNTIQKVEITAHDIYDLYGKIIG